MRRLQAGLRPLPEFAAVRDQHRLRMTVQDRLQGTAHLDRVQRARRRCGLPCFGTIADGSLHILKPCVMLLPAGRAGDQLRDGAADVRAPRELQAGASRTAAALQLGIVRIDLQEAAVGREGGRLAELQREVEALAQQQYAVGLRQHLPERAKARIVIAAWAFHADDGNAGARFQLRRAAAPARGEPGGAGEDQRAPCRCQCRQHLGRCPRIERRRFLRRSDRGKFTGAGRGILQCIGGQAQVHRAGPPGLRDAHGQR